MRRILMLFQRRDDAAKIHTCIIHFDKLSPAEKQYNMSLAQETLRYACTIQRSQSNQSIIV